MLQQIAPITKKLLIINIVFFGVSSILKNFGISLGTLLGAYFPGSVNFHFYQIFTYLFLHDGLAHLAFNMFGLYSFGSIIERTLGEKKFLILYFGSALGAYVLFNGIQYFYIAGLISQIQQAGINPQEIFQASKLSTNGELTDAVQNISTQGASLATQENMVALLDSLRFPTVGASGAIYGIFVAFGMLYPDQKVMLLFPPIPIKAKIMMLVFIGIEFVLGVLQTQGDHVAHFAHIGGALIAFVLIWYWRKNSYRIR